MTPRRLLVFMAAFAMACAAPLATAAAMIRSSAGEPPRSWAATAAADGVRVQVVINDFLVVSNIVDAGGPSAQAVVNAFGDSRGYAAYPYPGDIVLTAHGLSQGAAPRYPLIAQSDPTQPSSDVSTGPYHLHAHSTDDASSAVAQAEVGAGSVTVGTTQSTASAAHDAASGAVSADAATTAESVSIAGVLSIGRISSHAQMTATLGTPVQRSSDTEVGDITVGGQQVGLTDKGLVLVGTDVPLPPDSTANALLKSAGITVRYLAPAQTDSSTVAAGFSVGVQQNVPGVGPATVNYLFGQATASAQATGALATSATASVSGAGATGGAQTQGSPGAPGGAVTPGSSPAAGAITGSPSAAPPVTAAAPVASSGYALAATSGPSSASLYIVIAGGAIVMVAAAQLFRILAVKLAWT